MGANDRAIVSIALADRYDPREALKYEKYFSKIFKKILEALKVWRLIYQNSLF